MTVIFDGIASGLLLFLISVGLSVINPQYWQFWLGMLLVLVVLFARDGVMGGLRAIGWRLPGAKP